jgi:hypothetical protein
MAHIPETELERWLLRPDLLGDGERVRIAGHLGECPLCAGTADALRGFHEEFRSGTGAVHPVVERFVDAITPRADVLPLRPVTSPPDERDGSYTTVLAALTASPPAERFASPMSLAADGGETLVRFLYDRQEDTVTVFVQSSDPGRRRFALVLIPDAGVELLTDERGRVRCPAPQGFAEHPWGAGDALLVRPGAELSVRPEDLAGTFAGAPLRLAGVDVWTEGGSVHLRAARAPQPLTRAFVLVGDSSPRVLSFSGGSGSFPLPDPPSHFTLLLYA